ncbi:MAG: hypothetical protein ACMVY4_03620 [Minwuia sp.]|uniref:hypothetical protein n=1 Tax=Minwuia sp. TaxID=2493630 RepID=UPI003A8B024B
MTTFRNTIAATLAVLAIGGISAGSSADAKGPGGCPPGLAKKNNGCLPPGIAKKRYQIGQPVPDDVIIRYIPRDDYRHYPPVEDGYVYGRVDGDLLLIAEATRRVVDAVIAVDAATNAVND